MQGKLQGQEPEREEEYAAGGLSGRLGYLIAQKLHTEVCHLALTTSLRGEGGESQHTPCGQLPRPPRLPRRGHTIEAQNQLVHACLRQDADCGAEALPSDCFRGLEDSLGQAQWQGQG